MASALELETLTTMQRAKAVAEATYMLSRRTVALVFGRGKWKPLNGQRRRTETVAELIQDYRPDTIIETGSYTGSTTRFFASFGFPVFSVEIVPRHHYVARFRLRRASNVTLALGPSPLLLEWFRGPAAPPSSRALFYLDAHWGPDLPLRRELELIWDGWDEALVVIDDFKVPHDPAFGYDDYGPGKVIDLELCSLPPSVRAYWPNHSAKEESGFRRGACYMGRGPRAAEALARAATLGMVVPDGGERAAR